MAPSKQLRSADYRHCWQVFVIILAIAALTCSLATRTLRVTDPHGINAHGTAPQTMRQHLDRDAANWTGPIPVHTALLEVACQSRVVPVGPLLPSILFDENLYNRPPPSC